MLLATVNALTVSHQPVIFHIFAGPDNKQKDVLQQLATRWGCFTQVTKNKSRLCGLLNRLSICSLDDEAQGELFLLISGTLSTLFSITAGPYLSTAGDSNPTGKHIYYCTDACRILQSFTWVKSVSVRMFIASFWQFLFAKNCLVVYQTFHNGLLIRPQTPLLDITIIHWSPKHFQIRTGREEEGEEQKEEVGHRGEMVIQNLTELWCSEVQSTNDRYVQT